MGLIRIFLAAVVVVGHLSHLVLKDAGYGGLSPVVKLGMNAGFAVMFFFMISGYLISYSLDRKYPASPSGTKSFYKSRFIRIFSLYWPALIAAVLATPQGRGAFHHSIPDILGHIFIVGSDWNLVFADYPATHQAALVAGFGQAWSLAPELTFYALAPFLLRRPRTALIILLCSLGLRFYLAAPDEPFDALFRYWFFPSTICFFLLGHTARQAGDRIEWLKDGRVGLSLLILSAASMMYPDGGYHVRWDTLQFWCSVAFFAACLPGVFHATKDVKWMNSLGDKSYTLYLVHLTPIMVIRTYGLPDWLNIDHLGYWGQYGITAAYLGAALLLAYIIYHQIERRLARFMWGLRWDRLRFPMRKLDDPIPD